ncbi:MAG TPA: LLM class flavin-dependent oxidoreductase [Candidatus Sulfotelmatobacter sp.]|jgi:luciferase family oxidoreductase group 1|nr:LLM class flavin-dependent oxidoreductase [Candidatus Sulfotelmatobacter sp.]
MIPFSVLDLSPIAEGSTASDALRNSLELAQHAEKLGYKRFWLAEHHNMPGIASAATAVVIGYVAGGTKTIRVGSGGIMLPNHSPLVIAEQFGTLASLYPGRIDLGLGRAPGTDPFTMRALRRESAASSENFPEDVQELQRYLGEIEPGQRLRAIPGAGTHVPIWLLGSSLFSAQLAAALGLPFAFASHFAPADLMPALRLYRNLFKPSAQLEKPYAMVGVNVIAADTDKEAQCQFSSLQQSFTLLRRGAPGKVPPPIDDINSFWSPAEKAMAEGILLFSVVGSAETVERGLRKVIDLTQADELILAAHIYDHKARLRSFEIAANVRYRIASRSEEKSEAISAD